MTRRKNTQRSRRTVLGATVFALLAAPFIYDVLVVTDREEIDQLLDRAERALEAKDVEAILDCLAADFRSDVELLRGESASEFQEAIERWLGRLETVDIERDRNDVEISGELATATLGGATRLKFTSSRWLTRLQIPLTGNQDIGFGWNMKAGIRKIDGEGWRLTSIGDLDIGIPGFK